MTAARAHPGLAAFVHPSTSEALLNSEAGQCENVLALDGGMLETQARIPARNGFRPFARGIRAFMHSNRSWRPASREIYTSMRGNRSRRPASREICTSMCGKKKPRHKAAA
jgi:hypothetical protein